MYSLFYLKVIKDTLLSVTNVLHVCSIVSCCLVISDEVRWSHVCCLFMDDNVFHLIHYFDIVKCVSLITS